MKLSDVFSRWRRLALWLVGGGALGALMAFVQTPVYVSEMTISAVSSDEASIPGNSLLGALGGSSVLKAIGGLAGGRDVEESDFAYFVELLHSDRVIKQLLAKPEFVHELFAGEWDEKSQSWHRRSGVLPSLSGLYKRMFFGTGYQEPNVARAKRALTRRFSATFDMERNTYSLAMKHRSCEKATQMLTQVFRASDNVMKAEKRARYLQNIELLTGQLASPANTAIRSEIGGVLLNQQLRKIATESDFPIVARVIDGPGCGDQPYLPQPIAYVMAGALAGLMIVLASLAWRAWREPA